MDKKNKLDFKLKKELSDSEWRGTKCQKNKTGDSKIVLFHQNIQAISFTIKKCE